MSHMCMPEAGGRRQSWRCLPRRCPTPLIKLHKVVDGLAAKPHQLYMSCAGTLTSREKACSAVTPAKSTCSSKSSERNDAALQPAVAARFCPVLFERADSEVEGCPFDLPYRMVFAVATVETVIIYDTTGQQPLAILGGLHFEAAPITDIAWSCDGRYLAISSYDGESSIKHWHASTSW